jgi:hypothetical protein
MFKQFTECVRTTLETTAEIAIEMPIEIPTSAEMPAGGVASRSSGPRSPGGCACCDDRRQPSGRVDAYTPLSSGPVARPSGRATSSIAAGLIRALIGEHCTTLSRARCHDSSRGSVAGSNSPARVSRVVTIP